MSTIEDFKNAPTGATATHKEAGIRAMRTVSAGRSWVTSGGTHLTDKEMAFQGYTLEPPTPTSVREALEIAWELAHGAKEGQVIPKGTLLLDHPDHNNLTVYATRVDFTVNERESLSIRTVDLLPEPEPDWLDAPAILASHPLCADTERTGIWLPSSYKEGMWELPVQQGEFRVHWSELENVSPLYPKESQESVISIHKSCGSQVSTDEKDITLFDGDGERSGYSAACLECDEDLFPFEIEQVAISEVY